MGGGGVIETKDKKNLFFFFNWNHDDFAICFILKKKAD